VRLLGVVGVLALMGAVPAFAQQVPQQFLVERLYLSAPGGGWFAMDDLDIHGGLGGAIRSNISYANDPLRVSDGVHRVPVVANEAFLNIGAAITYQRWRFYLDLDAPFAIDGVSGTVGNYSFHAPALTLGSNPDTLADARVGTDVRLLGKPGGYFRLGAGAQLFIPCGDPTDYDSDRTFRGMIRALFAGDAPYFTYAAQLGVHIRPRDDGPVPGAPKGSELLYGVAAGAKIPLRRDRSWSAVIGSEVYGATAFHSFTDQNGTALEGLLTSRFEGTRVDRAQIRVKVGIGAGLNQHFGAAEWRLVAGIEVFTHGERAAQR
jgi:hypothetical protein